MAEKNLSLSDQDNQARMGEEYPRIPGYLWTSYGVLMKPDFVARQYDPEYVAHYDRLGKNAGIKMSGNRNETLLRLLRPRAWPGQPAAGAGGAPRALKLLDYGCGNGAFLQYIRRWQEYAWPVTGYDISGYPLAVDGVRTLREEAAVRAEEWDVVTFFDSLEHVHQINEVIGGLRTKWVMISLPWCHARALGAAWFAGWKHRKPEEHKWHFDAIGLTRFMARHQYQCLFMGNPEDEIRTPGDELPNILTGVFEKRTPPVQ